MGVCQSASAKMVCCPCLTALLMLSNGIVACSSGDDRGTVSVQVQESRSAGGGGAGAQPTAASSC